MEENKLTNSLSTKRFWLSIIIIAISLLLLLLTTNFEDEKWDTAFTAIVGLVGTWVGTVLAFYFSKENFDAASASTQKLVDSITTRDKLNSTLVKDAMIPISKIRFLMLEKGKDLKNYLLKELKEQYLTNFNRLPVLNNDSTIHCIIHKSLIDEFIAEKAIAGAVAQDLTLHDLINSTNYSEKVKGFSTVKESGSLITAKVLMENLTKGNIICSDVFVTDDGTVKTKVLGWITNVEIAKHSVV